MSCGLSLRPKVSSIPPSRISRNPAAEVNVDTVVEEEPRETLTQGVDGHKSVRYRTVPSTAPPSAFPRTPSSPPERNRSDVATVVSRDSLSPQATPAMTGGTVLVHQKQKQHSSPGDRHQAVRPIEVSTPSEPPIPEEFSRSDQKMQAIRPLRETVPLVTRAKPVDYSKYNLKTGEVPSLNIQRIWYKITETPDWNTIAVVPASEGLCVLDVAHGLGMMAVREPCDFVRVVNASFVSSDKNSSRQASFGKTEEPSYPYEYLDVVKQLQPDATSAAVSQVTKELLHQFDLAKRSGTLKDGKVFVVIDQLLAQPDAIALSRVVDKLIIGVRLGDTKFGSLRKTIEAVGGKERILGCVTINNSKEQ